MVESTVRAGASKNGRRLIGWKAIGQFLGCTERTARRWEADRELPVHRIPGSGRTSVWANPEELSAWLEALPGEVQAALRAEAKTDTSAAAAEAGSAPAAAGSTPHAGEATEASPESAAAPAVSTATASSALARVSAARGSRSLYLLALALIALAAAGGLVWKLSAHNLHPPPGSQTPYDDSSAARETYLTARFELATRTAESLAAAQRGFRDLVDRYPDRAAGWSGLADSYLLQREFGSMQDEAAYPQAARAARTAVALDPGLADAWLDEAFVAWWWHGDSATAFRAFETALRLEPDSAKAHHWYATALYAHGDYEKSLEVIARARVLDPANRAIVADEAWIRFGAGQRSDAVAALEHLAQLDRNFAAPHFYLAHAYLVLHRDADFLREARTAAELRGQTDVVPGLRLAEERLQAGGRQAMLDQLTDTEADNLARDAGSAVVAAEYRAVAEDRAGMLKWLAVAEQRHDHRLPDIPGYPEFSAYWSDPELQDILQRLQ